MTDSSVEASLLADISFNRQWYATRSRRHKIGHHVLQLLAIFLPWVTMLVELCMHVVSINLSLLFLVSILASLNVVLSPMQNWRRFKCAEIELGAVDLELRAALLAAGSDAIARAQVATAFVAKVREILLRYAHNHFAAMEGALKARPVG